MPGNNAVEVLISAYTSEIVELPSVQLTNIVSVSPSQISGSWTEISLDMGTAYTIFPKESKKIKTDNVKIYNVCSDFMQIPLDQSNISINMFIHFLRPVSFLSTKVFSP